MQLMQWVIYTFSRHKILEVNTQIKRLQLRKMFPSDFNSEYFFSQKIDKLNF